jgi:hypothetical protein
MYMLLLMTQKVIGATIQTITILASSVSPTLTIPEYPS